MCKLKLCPSHLQHASSFRRSCNILLKQLDTYFFKFKTSLVVYIISFLFLQLRVISTLFLATKVTDMSTIDASEIRACGFNSNHTDPNLVVVAYTLPAPSV